MRLNTKKLGSTMMQSKRWIAISLITLSVLLIAFKLTANTEKSVPTTHAPEQIIVHETDLNTVYLSDDSRKKLGIETAAVKLESIAASHTYGGETVVPTGGKLNVSAPVSGKLMMANKRALTPGAKVKAGQLLYHIQPIITADASANMINTLADANSLVNTAKSQVEATSIALQRAQKLLIDLVGSQRNVDEARAAHDVSLRNLEAATAKQKAINAVSKVGAIAPIAIKAPQSGMVSNIFAMHNQVVSAGSPIFEVSNLTSIWVRIPVPLGDLNNLDQQAKATVKPLSASANTQGLVAMPVDAPPSADPLTSSAHLYYAIQDSASTLRPGQRVSVSLKQLSESPNRFTIPWSAVVFDIYGGSWVYVQQTNNTFARNRVFVDYVSEGTAVIQAGILEKEKAVVNGALELFGVETGFSH